MVELGPDELEAMRLADLEGLYHEAAAGRMGVSRATFGRILASARRKVTRALVEQEVLVVREEGPVVEGSGPPVFGRGRGRGRRCHRNDEATMDSVQSDERTKRQGGSSR